MDALNKNKIEIFGLEGEASLFFEDNMIHYKELGLIKLPKSFIRFYSNKESNDSANSKRNYSLEALRNNTVHLSRPSEFNDPYDCSLRIDYDTFCDKKINEFIEENGYPISTDLSLVMKKRILMDYGITPDELKSELDNLYKNEIYHLQHWLVCCFSEPQLIYSNTMWAHYADNHKGFCIEYKMPEISKDDEKWHEYLLPWERSVLMHFYPVVYCDVRPDFTQKWLDMDNVLKNSDSYTDVFPYYQYGFLPKGKEWNYEHEWRFIYPPVKKGMEREYPLTERLKSQDNFEFFPIENVYLGCNITKEAQDEVIKSIGNRNIHLYKEDRSMDSYNSEFKEIEK